MSTRERLTNANKCIADAEQRQRQEQRNTQESQRKMEQRRNFVIGELVTRYFPSVRRYEPGTDAENHTRFESLEAFLYVLSTDHELVRALQDRAAQMVEDDPDGEWSMSL